MKLQFSWDKNALVLKKKNVLYIFVKFLISIHTDPHTYICMHIWVKCMHKNVQFHSKLLHFHSTFSFTFATLFNFLPLKATLSYRQAFSNTREALQPFFFSLLTGTAFSPSLILGNSAYRQGFLLSSVGFFLFQNNESTRRILRFTGLFVVSG